MQEAYLVIKTGCEGIEDLCYLTDSPKDALAEIEKMRSLQQKEREERRKCDIKAGLKDNE